MGDKIVWNTVHIKVPQEFITMGKNGAIKIKPPLTKTKKISSFNKEPAIQLEPADVEKVVIVDEGTTDTIDNMKGKKKKETEAQKVETQSMGNEDINRAETMHERMARLRSLRKKRPAKTTVSVPVEPMTTRGRAARGKPIDWTSDKVKQDIQARLSKM